jgi:hypothetical protein
MNKTPTTTDLLQAILEELRSQRQPLGFGHPPKPRYIYANRQYQDCLWYFWNGAKNMHEPIQYHAVTGIIEKLEIEEREFRGKPDLKVNLYIRADRVYVIQSGYDTLFSKGLIYTLSKLPAEAFRQPITIAIEPGDTDQVLFCRIYNPATGQAVFAPYTDQVDWNKVTQRAIGKITSAHGEIPSAEDPVAPESQVSDPVPPQQAQVRQPAPTTSAPATAAIDVTETLNAINLELERIGWDRIRGGNYLQQTYRKKTRADLTPDELNEFLQHLKNQPTAQKRPA